MLEIYILQKGEVGEWDEEFAAETKLVGLLNFMH